MIVTIEKSKVKGTVEAPPSKSVGHRALICGAFSSGSTIKNIGFCDDTLATLDCLEKMGAKVERSENSIKIGSLNPFADSQETLYCNQSASTLRFLVPIGMLSEKLTVFSGSGRLMQRPMEVYCDIAQKNDIAFIQQGNTLTVGGTLKSGTYEVRGDISSQFITGLMFALSRIEGDSTIKITGNFESASYVDITRNVMRDFGVEVEKTDDTTFKILGRSEYCAKEYCVEGDYSNAAFLDAFNFLGSEVRVDGLNPESAQGDRVYKQMFQDLKNGKREFDLSDCPDLAPIMFSMAAALGGARFKGTRRLQIKESDRAKTMQQELKKFGIEVEVLPDTVIVKGGQLKTPTETLFGHDDHRIVMSLALLCTVTGGVIEGAEAVSKSFPEFFQILKSLKASVKIDET